MLIHDKNLPPPHRSHRTNRIKETCPNNLAKCQVLFILAVIRTIADSGNEGSHWSSAKYAVYSAQTTFWPKVCTVMSLLAGYSSDEDGTADVTNDVFSLGSLPAAKKPRVEQPHALTPIAAPHVLAEVCFLHMFSTIDSHGSYLGSIKSKIANNSTV